MDPTSRFVQRENLSKLLDRFYREENPEQRSMLEQLLLKEMDSYGFCMAQLGMANSYIVDAQHRIAQQKARIKKLGPVSP